MRVWRLVRKRRLPDAFTGEGARLAGGRWNSVGVRVVYASATRSLAQLEYLVHVNPPRAPRDVYAIYADIPERLKVDDLAGRRLPKSWRRYDPPVEELQVIGDRWVASLNAAVLRVPSAVVPAEDNFLLNPAHKDFSKIVLGKAEPVEFDPRLFVPRDV